MTREELINLAGSEEKAERAIDAILASIKPAFVAKACNAAGIDIKLHRFFVGYVTIDGEAESTTVDTFSESAARRASLALYGVKSIITVVDLGDVAWESNDGVEELSFV